MGNLPKPGGRSLASLLSDTRTVRWKEMESLCCGRGIPGRSTKIEVEGIPGICRFSWVRLVEVVFSAMVIQRMLIWRESLVVVDVDLAGQLLWL